MKEDEENEEDLDDNVMSKSEKVFFGIIVLIVFVIIALLLEYFFIYRNSSEFIYGVGMEIETVEVSSDLNKLYLTVSGGVIEGGLKKINFIFLDHKDLEYYYETEVGILELSNKYKSGYWDWVLERDRFNGRYLFEVNAGELELSNFDSVLFVRVGGNVDFSDGRNIDILNIDKERVYKNNVYEGFEITDVGEGSETEFPLPDEFRNIYFVDKDSLGGKCSDLNLGGINDPWCSIEKANSVLVSGEKVFIRGGNYSETIMPKNSGVSQNYITYSNYLDDEVIIFGVENGIDLFLLVLNLTLSGAQKLLKQFSSSQIFPQSHIRLSSITTPSLLTLTTQEFQGLYKSLSLKTLLSLSLIITLDLVPY